MSRSDQAFALGDDVIAGLTVLRDGLPVDLTGKRIELRVRSSEASTVDLLTLSSVSGAPPLITITNAVGGLATADLSNLLGTAGRFWYQSWIADVTDPELDKETWAYGAWVVGGAPVAGGPCDLWADDLPPACLAELPDEYDPTTVLAVATSTLWRLSGRRFGLCSRTIRPCMEDCSGPRPWGNGTYLGGYGSPPPWGVYSSGVWWPYATVCGSCPDSCSCSQICEIRLLGPVSSITEVTVDGVTLDPSAYRIDNRRLLVRTDGECWPRCQDLSTPIGEEGTFSVSYVRGLAPPPDAVRAVTDLAFEIAKAECGVSGCKLPSRLTSISRQGITVDTMIDDLDFLERGRTGLYFVDLFLRSVNPKGVSRGARVYRADDRQPRATLG